MQDGEASDVNSRPREIQTGSASLSRRFLALCLYLGFAPAACFLRGKHATNYGQTHFRQALTLWGALGILGLLMLSIIVCYSVLVVRDRSWAESRSAEVWILSFGRKCLLVWSVFWFLGIWRCLRGSSHPVPYLDWLSRRVCFRRLGSIIVSLFFVAMLTLVPFTLYADHLATGEPEKGRVFLLYDDLDIFPRPLFSVAMYRMIRETLCRWGPDSAVLLPLTRENIDLSLATGKIVFIGSHGTSQGLLLRDGYYRPQDVAIRNGGKSPLYVYLAGCDSGTQREAWERAFSPATVKSYDRMTPTLEHLLWLWTSGPRLVQEMSDTTDAQR